LKEKGGEGGNVSLRSPLLKRIREREEEANCEGTAEEKAAPFLSSALYGARTRSRLKIEEEGEGEGVRPLAFQVGGRKK